MIVKRIPDKDILGLPKGIWLDEPDFLLWTDKDTGYECIVQRVSVTFALCGYVGLPDNHPLFQTHYNDPIFDHCTASHGVFVHGGLTYSDQSSELHQIFSKDIKSNWFYGFDCAHCFDKLPALMKLSHNMPEHFSEFFSRGIYRDIDYVKNEVSNLASQLKKADIDVSALLLASKNTHKEKQ
jgi:thiol-disulfide isomerase/thioredoxin